MIKYRILIGLCCTFLSNTLELGGSSELMQQDGPPQPLQGNECESANPVGMQAHSQDPGLPWSLHAAPLVQEGFGLCLLDARLKGFCCHDDA